MQKKEKPLHAGHRQRMRDKFFAHGGRFFETYELLEMLLYNVIPYKDTKPIAKRLLLEFGSLEGVFSASVSELVRVDGVGERCAEFLLQAGRISAVGEITSSNKPDLVFDDYRRAGRFVCDYFKDNTEAKAMLVLLDGSMRILGTEKILNADFGSGSVSPSLFIVPAMKLGAEVAIIGYKSPSGALFPTEPERETSRRLFDGLADVGVTLAEQYIISGEDYLGIGTGEGLRFSARPRLQSFAKSKEAAVNEQ